MVASSWTHLCMVVLSSDSPLLVPLLLLPGNTSQMSCLLQVLIYALPWRKPKWGQFFILRCRNCSLPILPKVRLCNFHSVTYLYSVCVLVSQLCPTLCDPMVCSLPCSSVRVIFQARILEWIAFSTPGDLLNPGERYRLCLLHWQAPPGKPQSILHSSNNILAPLVYCSWHPFLFLSTK